MRIFGMYAGERVPLDIPEDATVKHVKDTIRTLMNIPEDLDTQDGEKLSLLYGGADLNEQWVLTDMGLKPGITLKVCMKTDVHPVLFVYCVYNQEIVNVYNDVQVREMSVGDLRSYVSRKTGLPLGVFRLMTKHGKEMFDCNDLSDYDVELGQVLQLRTWDGWNELLKMTTLGFTSQVMSLFSLDDTVARYQAKVALFMAAHHGHIDLAVALLKHGLRADEPTGQHPLRLWCSGSIHPDLHKAPVHQATEQGQLGVLRAFVNHDLNVVMARDINGLTPLNISLRRKVKNCASFLLTKQWSRVAVNKTQSLNLTIYCRVRAWCDRAKERVFTFHGIAKSSQKRRQFSLGSIVSNGVLVDGFSRSQMNAKSKPSHREYNRKLATINEENREHNPEQYFRQMATLQQFGNVKMKRTTKWNRMVDRSKLNIAVANVNKTDERGSTYSGSPTPSLTSKEDVSPTNTTKLQPLSHKVKILSLSHQNLGTPETNTMSKTSILKKAFVAAGRNSMMSRATVLSQSVPNLPNSLLRESGEDEKSPSGLDSESVSPSKLDTSLLLSKAQTGKNVIPLPVINYRDTAQPMFCSGKGKELISSTLALYRRYRGMKARDYAIKCMGVANSFSEKPWLERVNMAVALNSRHVKRPRWPPAKRSLLEPLNVK